jgi:hypothetical protein
MPSDYFVMPLDSMELPGSYCGSRKLIATSNRPMSTRLITRLAAHNGKATHRPLALPGSGQPLAVGPAAAPDNPGLTPDAYASGDNTEISSQEPPQMALVQDEHVIQAFATNTSDQPLKDLFDPHVPYPLPKVSPIDRISITQEIPRYLVPREGFDYLLCGPFLRWVLRDVKMDNAAPFMGQDEQHEEHSVGYRWHDKEIQGDQVLEMILQKGLPGWRR